MSRLIINIVALPTDEMNEAVWLPGLDFQDTPGFEFVDAANKRVSTPTSQFDASVFVYRNTEHNAAYQYCARISWRGWTSNEYGLFNTVVERTRWIGFDLNHGAPALAVQAILSGLEPMLGGQQTASRPTG